MGSAHLLILLVCLMCHMGAGQEECYEINVANAGEGHLLALDVCEINSLLGSDPPNWEMAREIYRNGKSAKKTTLKDIATAQYPTKLYQKYAVFFGDNVWLDTMIEGAFTGVAPFTTPVKREQVIKKLLQASVLTQEFFFHIDSAVLKIEAGNPEGALASLDQAMGVFYGADTSCSPFGNGQKRAIEFGTIADGVANANSEIHAAIKRGADALQSDDNTSDRFTIISDARLEMVKQVTIIYVQATFKYATLVDTGLEAGDDVEKSQAEGFAYYQSILPLIADVDPEGADNINKAFDLSAAPNEELAENVLAIMRTNFEKLDIAEDDVGEFDKDAAGSYQEPDEKSCRLNNPFTLSDVANPGDIDR